jgi:transposase
MERLLCSPLHPRGVRRRTIPVVMPLTVDNLVLRRSASNGINTRMRHTRDLTDEQWQTLDPLIPRPRKRRDGRGRPWKSRRSVLNGILWVLRTGAPGAGLPDRYPSFQTRHWRFQQLVRSNLSRIPSVPAMWSNEFNSVEPQFCGRLKRYRRRWKIERLFAWLQVVRYEHHAENSLGMLQLASSLILLRHL